MRFHVIAALVAVVSAIPVPQEGEATPDQVSRPILPLLPFRPLLPLAGLGLGLAAPLAGLATGGALAAGSAIGGFWDGVRNGFGDDDDDDYYYYY